MDHCRVPAPARLVGPARQATAPIGGRDATWSLVLPETQFATPVRGVHAHGELLEPVEVRWLEVVAEVLEVTLHDALWHTQTLTLLRRYGRQPAQAIRPGRSEAGQQVIRRAPVRARCPHGERER